jgi:hypothetical protein
VDAGLRPDRRSGVSAASRHTLARVYNHLMREALADLTATIHLAYFGAVVVAFVCIAFGPQRWNWTRNIWFRLAHLLAIAIVVVEDAGAFSCPLNNLEWGLRTTVNGTREASAGVGGLLDLVLFHTLSGRVLNGLWWVFAVLGVALLFLKPPASLPRKSSPARLS